jgi:hypothetical protein
MPTNNAKESVKSTVPDKIAEIGIVNLGKYTFVRRLVLSTKLLDACDIAFEKNIHGTRAVNAKSGYGRPSEGILASLPKKTLNMAMVDNG